MRPPYALPLFFALVVALAGCDLISPSDDGPPASVTGDWSTGDVAVSVDTTFTVDDDPTYAAVEIDAVLHVQTELDLTDTAGDVRGYLDDGRYATGEIRYRRHDGVVVRDPYTNDRLGAGSSPFEAVYTPPTLTVTRVTQPVRLDAFDGLALDFADGTAVMVRRVEVPVRLGRLGDRVVTVVRGGIETTFRPVPRD